MLKNYIFIIAGLLLFSDVFSEDTKVIEIKFKNISQWYKTPVLNGGRIQPIDTVSSELLLAIHHKTSIGGSSSTEWLLRNLIKPNESLAEKIFKIRNNAVVEALGMKPAKKQLYSFVELNQAMQTMLDSLKVMREKSSKSRSLVENQIIALMNKMNSYWDMNRTMTCLINDIKIDNEAVAVELGVSKGSFVNYYFLFNNKSFFSNHEKRLNDKPKGDFDENDTAIREILDKLNKKWFQRGNYFLTLIPESIEKTSDLDNKWKTPWGLLEAGTLNDFQKNAMNSLGKIINGYANDSDEAFSENKKWIAQFKAAEGKLGLEVFYNKMDFFYKSLLFYLIGFILMVAFWFKQKPWMYKIMVSVMAIGFFLHTSGMVMRMIIRGRPPVSNLYESILFVGWVAVLCGLLLELKFRDSNIGLPIAALMGSLLHFVSFSYAAEGNHMGMLVAVLDSNFWLATHVVTITIGYGATFVAGIIGHIYLVNVIKKVSKEKLRETVVAMKWMTIFALFFTTLGTILGGIWADQSWGRFWGWDPKENGALLIVLWLLIIIHGRLANIFKEVGYAFGLLFGNIVVIIAWFGVNLLGVGLHNYGFDSGIATGIIVFSSVEVMIACVLALMIQYRKIKSVPN